MASMNMNDSSKDQERKSQLRKYQVAHHEQNPRDPDNNHDQEEDLKIQDKGSYGHNSQDQQRGEDEATHSHPSGPATAGKEQNQSPRRKQDGLGQPFQNQRNPGQRKPLESDIDPTE